MRENQNVVRYSDYVKDINKSISFLSENKIKKFNISKTLSKFLKQFEEDFGNYELSDIKDVEFFVKLSQVDDTALSHDLSSCFIISEKGEEVAEIKLGYVSCEDCDYIVITGIGASLIVFEAPEYPEEQEFSEVLWVKVGPVS